VGEAFAVGAGSECSGFYPDFVAQQPKAVLSLRLRLRSGLRQSGKGLRPACWVAD